MKFCAPSDPAFSFLIYVIWWLYVYAQRNLITHLCKVAETTSPGPYKSIAPYHGSEMNFCHGNPLTCQGMSVGAANIILKQK